MKDVAAGRILGHSQRVSRLDLSHIAWILIVIENSFVVEGQR
jgi:hypothetical protein